MAFIEKEAKKLLSFKKKRYFTNSARAGIYEIIKMNMKVGAKGILLPSYIGFSKVEGSGVFDPIKQSGIDYDFYRVDKKLEPSLENIEELLKTGKYHLILLIHYFGFCQADLKSLVKLCKKYNVKVIEDCAHLPPRHSNKNNILGYFGDFSVYSIHKNIATKDGGFFLCHNDLFNNDTYHVPKNSSINKKSLEEFTNTSIDDVTNSKLKNYKTVASWVINFDEIELLYEDVKKGEFPLNCPIIVSNNKREELYFSLIKQGIIPTALYHSLIKEIDRTFFGDSYYVSQNILNLPTHPDISPDDFNTYLKKLKFAIIDVFDKKNSYMDSN